MLATRRLTFLSRFYAIISITFVIAFQAVELLGGGLHAAWGCMLAFSIVRVCAFGLALRRGPSGAPSAERQPEGKRE